MCSPVLMGGAIAGTQIIGQQMQARKTNKTSEDIAKGYIGDLGDSQASVIAQNFVAAQNQARKSFAFQQQKEQKLARINVRYGEQYSLHGVAQRALKNSAMDAEWASAQAGELRAMKTQEQMDLNHRKLLAGLASLPTVSRGEQAMSAISSGVSGGAYAYETDLMLKAQQ